MALAAIHMNLNDPLSGTNPGKYNHDLTRSGGVFATVVNAPWKRGDVIHYWVYVIYEGLGRQKLEQSHRIAGPESSACRGRTSGIVYMTWLQGNVCCINSDCQS